ncbi:isoaspartyl peptidase/L-asparaginase-like, partial [Asbolus verrucosus]
VGCFFVRLIQKKKISRCSQVEPIVLVHGGADYIPEHRIQARLNGVKNAASLGYKVLKRGGSVTDAVEEAVRSMEADESFNAGYGSALNLDGEIEMDASIMVGSNMSSGAVTVVKNIEHPVSLARLVMEKSPHFSLAGEGAKRFARDQRVPLVHNLVTKIAKADLQEVHHSNQTQLEMRGGGGVGAIAINSNGQLAAASSSGGGIGRMPGRCSDASVIGASIYVTDDVGAVAATGYGESIARYNLAHEIVNHMKRGFDAGVATRNGVKGLTERFHRPSGAITISKTGQIGISFTSEKMAWAYQVREDLHFGIDDYDDFNEKIIL